jgi:predicted ATPase
MISSFQLKFGPAPGSSAKPISATPVTVFVGPNSSGKSLVFSEIAKYCQSGISDLGAMILSDINFVGLSNEKAAQEIERITVKPRPGESISIGNIFVGSRYGRKYRPTLYILLFKIH